MFFTTKKSGPEMIPPTCRICPATTTEMHQLAESLGKAIDAKDHHTRQHSDEVAELAQTLALAMGLTTNMADHIHIAGHLHDIGKIGIPDSILLKFGPLSDDEWRVLKRHPIISGEIIAPVRFMADNGIVEMVRHHHESYDGSGYPDGLAGAEIPLGARIIAVADGFSAMLQDRPYRTGMSFREGLAEIQALSGIRYDPRVVRLFLGITEITTKIMRSLKGGPLTTPEQQPANPDSYPQTGNKIVPKNPAT